MADGQRAKNLLKRTIRSTIRTVGPLFTTAKQPTSRILTYHSTGYRTYEMNVTPENFAEQMAWLASNSTVISLDEAAQGMPGVAITFDDGYADNLYNALPILATHALPATLFVVSGHLGGTLPGEREPDTGRLLTAAELREVHASGISIGAHTVNHPHLAHLDEAAQRHEIEVSKHQLEDILGAPVPAFAYPYGSALDYTEVTEQLVARAGFQQACSNRYGHNSPPKNRWALRRIWIDETDTLASFQDKVSGRLDALAIQDSATGIRFRRWLNRSLGTS